MTEKNRLLLSITKSFSFENSFPDFYLVLDSNGNLENISSSSNSDGYKIRRKNDRNLYALKAFGLDKKFHKINDGKDLGEELLKSLRLQFEKKDSKIESFDCFAIELNEDGSLKDCMNVSYGRDDSFVVAFVIERTGEVSVQNEEANIPQKKRKIDPSGYYALDDDKSDSDYPVDYDYNSNDDNDYYFYDGYGEVKKSDIDKKNKKNSKQKNNKKKKNNKEVVEPLEDELSVDEIKDLHWKRVFLIFIPIVMLPLLFYVESYYKFPYDYDTEYFYTLYFLLFSGIFCVSDKLDDLKKSHGILRVISYALLIPVVYRIVMWILGWNINGPTVMVFVSSILSLFYLGEYSLMIILSMLLYYLGGQSNLGIMNIEHSIPIGVVVTVLLIFSLVFSSFYKKAVKKDFVGVELTFLIFGLAIILAGVIQTMMARYLAPIFPAISDLRLLYIGIWLSVCSIITMLLTKFK